MEPKVGQTVNLEHFFSVLALKMFCRYAINHEFPDSGKRMLMLTGACWTTLAMSARFVADCVLFPSLPSTLLHTDVWSELASRGSNIIGESIVLGLPVTTLIPRVRPDPLIVMSAVATKQPSQISSPFVPLPAQVKKLLDDTEKFHRKVDPLIDARVLLMNKGEEMPDDVLTVMVREKMTRQQMYSHLVTMLAAGHDTTAYCTCYTLFLLAKNPEVRK